MSHPSAIEATTQDAGIAPRPAQSEVGAGPAPFFETLLTGRYKLPGRDP